MSQEQILLACFLLLFGSTVNSLVGFGAGLVAIPLLVWIDVPLPSAIVIVNLSASIQCLWMCIRYRKHIPWRPAMSMHVIRVLMVPVGVVLLVGLVAIGPDRVKQVIGCLLLIVLFMIWILDVQPRRNLHQGWTLLAGTTSGILNGAVGMGGPAAVLWVMAHDWSSRRARSCLWTLILTSFPVQLLMLWWQFGDPILRAMVLGLAMTPVCIVGTLLGLRLGALLPIRRLRRVAYLIIAALAISSIVGPWV